MGMRRLAVVLVLVSGCVRGIGPSGQEICGTRGMVLDGVTVTSGTAVARAGDTRAIAHSYGESISCRRVVTKEEKCEAYAAQFSWAPKARYQAGGRNMLIGIGWLLLLIPGAIAYNSFNNGRTELINGSNAAGEAAYARCMQGA